MYEHMFNNTFPGYSNVKVRFRVSNRLDPDQDHGPSVLIWIETVLKGYQPTTIVSPSKERGNILCLTELVKLKQKMAEQSHIGSKSDHVIRKLQNQEQDLIEVFGINDFLLAILEVRLEEAGREKDIRQRDVEQLQSERKRYLFCTIFYILRSRYDKPTLSTLWPAENISSSDFHFIL